LLDRFFVHASGVVVAHFGLKRISFYFRICNLFQDVMENIAVALREFIEAAPSRLIAGDGIVFSPAAAGELVATFLSRALMSKPGVFAAVFAAGAAAGADAFADVLAEAGLSAGLLWANSVPAPSSTVNTVSVKRRIGFLKI
jgi:hypothetical protein